MDYRSKFIAYTSRALPMNAHERLQMLTAWSSERVRSRFRFCVIGQVKRLVSIALSLSTCLLTTQAAGLDVHVMQQRLGSLPNADGTSQFEIEFSVTNTGTVDLYDVRIEIDGAIFVSIPPQNASIRINTLPAGTTETIRYMLDAYGSENSSSLGVFGHVEAINTTTQEIESSAFLDIEESEE